MESSLYLPVKRFLEKLGFEVKGDICGCDLVAVRDGEPPAIIIGELKLTFTLAALQRTRLTSRRKAGNAYASHSRHRRKTVRFRVPLLSLETL